MKVNDLISSIAYRDSLYPEDTNAPRGSRHDELPTERFVAPELGVEYSPDSPDVPNVVLIYAPAAVGKSVLARYLATITKNPYWDLAAFRLGSSFFTGNIGKAFGVPAVEDFIDRLRIGDITLILDGADEAAVGSTSTGYLAAIDDLAGLLRGTAPKKVQAVLFGREETVMETTARLESHDVRYQILSVKYFSESAAREFVKVLARKEGEVALLPDFESFLDEFFSRVTEAFASEDWSEVESFLGYAPVLDSVAIFYKTADNAYASLKRFTAPSSRLAVWELLYDLILSIMERERTKFANSFGGDHEAKIRFAASAYTVEYQCRLLLTSDPASVPAQPDLTDEVDAEWLGYIDAKVLDWFGQHPFTPAFSANNVTNPMKAFANAAFRDFVVSLGAGLGDWDLLERTAGYLRAHDVSPSVILSRFVEVRAKRGVVLDLPGSIVAAVVDSHAAGGLEHPTLWIVEDVEGTETETSANPVVNLAYGSDDDTGALVQLPVEMRGELILGRQVSNLVALLPSYEIAIGHMYAEAQLGPRTLLRCATFSSRSPEVRVVGAGQDRVVVEARGVGGVTRLIHGFEESLALRVPSTSYPWQKFHSIPSANGEVTQVDLLSLGLELRVLSAWFAHGSGKFDAVKMDTILAKGRASRWMFEYCTREDVIWRDGKDYRFHSPFSAATIKAVDVSQIDYRRWLMRAWKFIYG